ncbi:MAG: FimV/HubP family polar landmark protein [Mariprofundaceae bacterium]|nr:FimV/HubP family polar landmark protein [Mariprofundaceae bacterium]
MRNRVVLGLLAVAGWLFPVVGAHAVSLGKIDVASHLGEPFYAEVPLVLEAGENVSSVFVELASPADYRILEVYRDPALNMIRADVESDSRGVRVELSSRNAMEAPFFNLVLKVRYNRATHFKKFPIFLDLPKAIKPEVRAPLPTVSSIKPGTGEGSEVTAPVVTAPVTVPEKVEEPKPAFTPHAGWARISRYGPMVYGDTISTVADRLRIDDRYTRNQVMVALFEKNRSKFDQDNINLIKAGTYLDVPDAAEVERISVEQANSVIAEHEKRWKELRKQPRYAAVAEAQRTRYSKRIRVGEMASGTAAAPVAVEKAQEKGAAPAGETTPEKSAAPAGKTPAGQAGAVTTGVVDGKTNELVETLQQQNEELQAKLAEKEKKIATLSARAADADVAAARARIKRLELQLARLQSELDAAREKTVVSGGADWLTYALAVVIVILLGLVGFLMRRERPHPAAASAQAAAEMPVVEEPVEEVEEVEVEEAASEAPEATMQMDTGEVAEPFTDSVPELTDSDTAEMEAFTEAVEEEPDPNVDYVAEADVYLRYGMDEEALQQLKMALRLRPDDVEAHIKRIQILHASGDAEGLEAAKSEAESALIGEALERFLQAFENLGQEGAADGELEDTLSPAADMAASEAEMGAAFDEGAGETVAEGSTETMAETLDISDLELPDETEEAEAAETAETAETQAAAEVETTVDVPVEEEETEVLTEISEEIAEPETGEAPAAAEEPVAEAPEEAKEEQAEIISEDTGGLEFDLSDIELPGEEAAEGEESSSAGPSHLETADLEKTVLMDWSRETSVDSGEMESGTEGGAEETAAEPEAESAAPEEAAQPAEEAAEPEAETSKPATLDLDASDLDIALPESPDEGAEESAGAVDDFTSTIQTTLTDIKLDQKEKKEADFSATGEHDLQPDPDKPGDEPPPAAAPAGEAPAADQDDSVEEIALDFDLDDEEIDATQQLDNLLNEISGDSEEEDK